MTWTGRCARWGVGDLSVGKHVKRMGEAFYGRVKSYDAAVEASSADGGAELADAIARNVFRCGW